MFFLWLPGSVSFAEGPDKLLKIGMSGDDIKFVQKILTEGGFYTGAVDGVFGLETLDAVGNFQAYNGLSADGIVGQETLLYLKRGIRFDTSRFRRSLDMTATAYTRYDPGCTDYTYRGSFLRKGLVAVDPNVIPLGTRLFIPGYGFAIADDIGGAIKGLRIDLAYETRAEALQFGRKKVKVYIVE